MQRITRGATVTISVQFLDADGNATTPTSPTVELSYRGTDGRRQAVSLNLSSSGSDWVATWDSRDASSGMVYGHATTDDPTPISAEDFEFALTQNLANV